MIINLKINLLEYLLNLIYFLLVLHMMKLHFLEFRDGASVLRTLVYYVLLRGVGLC